jgi:hypothetical protein
VLLVVLVYSKSTVKREKFYHITLSYCVKVHAILEPVLRNETKTKILSETISLSYTANFSRYVEKRTVRPNPPAPFPYREGGEIKAFLLIGERSSRYCEKSLLYSHVIL